MAGESKPILVVDDDPDIRDVLVVLLEMKGYAVVPAAGAAEALAALRGDLRPCLIVFDLGMPEKSGWEFRAELLADTRTARIPAVAMSALVRGEEVRQALDVEAVLPKPLDVDRLLSLAAEHCVCVLGTTGGAPKGAA